MSPIIVSSTHNNRLGHCLQPTGRERAGAEKCRVWIMRHTHLQRKNVISSMQNCFSIATHLRGDHCPAFRSLVRTRFTGSTCWRRCLGCLRISCASENGDKCLVGNAQLALSVVIKQSSAQGKGERRSVNCYASSCPHKSLVKFAVSGEK